MSYSALFAPSYRFATNGVTLPGGCASAPNPFLEVNFPGRLTFGSTGGPSFMTLVTPLDSGAEKRNVRWPIGRHKYNAAGAIHTEQDYREVLSLFMAARGRGYGFRWKDWLDYKTSEPVGFADSELLSATCGPAVGDGVTATFYLAKKYTFGLTVVYRPISKPVAGTVRIGVAGVEQTPTTHFAVDTTTGAVTFATPPSVGQVITGGCEFDVPVRFDTDELPARIANRSRDSLLIDFDVPIIEIRP